MTQRPASFTGLIQIVITPFHPDGSIDVRSLERLVGDALAGGASALTVLGVSSEAAFLDENERRSVVRVVAAVNGDAVPIVVGITDTDPAVVDARAGEAEEQGAAAVMLAPTARSGSLSEWYGRVARAAPGIGSILQDFPGVGHAPLSAEDIAVVARDVPSIAAIYHEDAPTSVKISSVLELRPDLPQIGGLGALWLPWEMRAGARGAMTGFAVPELIRPVIEAGLRDDWHACDAAHALALPLIAWEAQPVIGLAHRKAMLVQRGIIDCPLTRAPLPPTPRASADAVELTARLERQYAGESRPAPAATTASRQSRST